MKEIVNAAATAAGKAYQALAGIPAFGSAMAVAAGGDVRRSDGLQGTVARPPAATTSPQASTR